LKEYQKKDSNVFGLTKFSDMSVEEFKGTMLTYRPTKNQGDERKGPRDGKDGKDGKDGENGKQEPPHQGQRPPPPPPQHKRNLRTSTVTSFDWRDYNAVTPVKDQGYCGSCWAHSAVETVESAWFLAGNVLTEFSVEQVTECDTKDGGCNGGNTPTAYEYIEKAGGLALASTYPYSASTYNGTTGSCEAFTVAGGQISGYTWAATECTSIKCNDQDEDGMAANIASTQPASICVYAESWQDYVSGIMAETDCKNGEFSLDHCVQAVGFSEIDLETGYWIVRNSWNTDWGVDGYIYLAYGTNTCGVADEATFVTVK